MAPPDHHLVVRDRDGRVGVLRGPRQNRHRPSVDTLFRSAAYSFGPRVIGVVLTGNLSDGSAGLRSIRSRGGTTIVQDPREAAFPSMPSNALQAVDVDYCVPLAKIAPLMVKLASEPASSAGPPSKELEMEIRHDQGELSVDLDQLGKPSYFTCPECHGTLWEIHDGDMLRYRCRVGHGYSADGLIDHMDETLEDSLWEATRSLMENAHLKERVANRLLENGRRDQAERMRSEAALLRRRAEVFKRVVIRERSTES